VWSRVNSLSSAANSLLCKTHQVKCVFVESQKTRISPLTCVAQVLGPFHRLPLHTCIACIEVKHSSNGSSSCLNSAQTNGPTSEMLLTFEAKLLGSFPVSAFLQMCNFLPGARHCFLGYKLICIFYFSKFISNLIHCLSFSRNYCFS
jgi:hypothetical protein